MASDTTISRLPTRLGSLGLLVLLLGVFLPMTDFFIVNVALPTIDRDLHASAGMLQLVVAGYSIAYALFLVVGSRIGDAVGRRRLFLFGMASFTIMSAACGLAPDPAVLVTARVLQGLAGALMVPQVLSTIQATTDATGRSRALGFYGATGGVAAVVGQIAGGLLVAANLAGTGWRPIFLVNVPIGLLGLVLGRRLVPDTRSHAAVPVDHAGTAALGLTVLALLVPLTEGRSLGWPVWTIILLISSPVAAMAFVRIERRIERRGGTPLVPFSVVNVASMRRGLLTAFPFFAGFAGFMFVYALATQQGAGFSPLRAGLALSPLAVTFLVTSLATARLLVRFGRRIIGVGALLQGTGIAGLLAVVLVSWPRPTMPLLVPVMAVLGVGQGLVMTPILRVVLSDVPPEIAGVGSGVLTTTQQIALATGVATIGSLYLSLASPGVLGVRDATGVVLTILVVVAGALSVLSRRLPEFALYARGARGDSTEIDVLDPEEIEALASA